MSTTLTPAEAQKLLSNLSPGTKIEISKTPDGEIIVSEANVVVTKVDIVKEKFANLIGNSITVSEAAEKYDIPRSTIQSWIYRSNYISFKDGGSYPKKIDEADIAYCAEIYHQRKEAGIGPRTPLLDENGLPYELKHPGLAKYRKQKREQT